MDPIVNKVANSGLVSLDLEEILIHPNEIKVLDIKDYLFQGLILKEKDYRQMLKDTDWSIYQGSVVAIINSEGAIIPTWAYMLLVTYLKENSLYSDLCNPEEIVERYYFYQIHQMDLTTFDEKRVVLKGCGKLDIPQSIYNQVSSRLLGRVKSLMYGEPCSTVPVYKKR